MDYRIITLALCASVVTIFAQVPGELNDSCRTVNECRNFGYLCAKNRTCQCLQPLYVPNRNRDKCVGVIDQKCKYDEHCIEGAFCVNQAKCMCKENLYPDGDGLMCSNRSSIRSSGQQIVFSCIVLYLLHRCL